MAKLPQPIVQFWFHAFIVSGIVSASDIHTHIMTVRGGEWRLTIFNDSQTDVSIEIWLAFMYDGAD